MKCINLKNGRKDECVRRVTATTMVGVKRKNINATLMKGK